MSNPVIFPIDNYRSLVSFYGDPDPDGDGVANPGWESNNLVNVKPPFEMRLAWNVNKPLKSIRIHKKCADSLSTILEEIFINFKREQELINLHRINLFGGSYSFRRARGLSRLSTHAFGAAIDIDPAYNPLGKKHDKVNGIHQAVVNIFNKHGWVWGGDFSRPDCMHFQAARLK